MKKIWKNPSLLEIGVENTNEDGIITIDIAYPFPDGATVAKCLQCGKIFFDAISFNKHRKDPGHDTSQDLVDYLKS